MSDSRGASSASGVAWPGGWKPVAYRERCERRKAELAQSLAAFLEYCAGRPDIAAVLVFGSYARNRISPWSDIDVLVVRDAPSDARSIDLARDLYRDGGLDGDIVAVPTSRYPDGLRATPLGQTILREGSTVYARSPR